MGGGNFSFARRAPTFFFLSLSRRDNAARDLSYLAHLLISSGAYAATRNSASKFGCSYRIRSSDRAN